MKNYFGKIVFVAAIIVIALFSRVFYTKPYPTITGVAKGGPSSTGVPTFMLPSLSAIAVNNNITVQGPGGDLETGNAPSSPVSKSFVSAQATPGLSANAGIEAPVGAVVGSLLSRVGSKNAPAIDAQALLVADLASSAPFLRLNETKRWPMASITKLMTATIVLDKLSLVQQVTVTPEAFVADPSERTLRSGGTYTVADLLRVMLLPSSNVAAETLASAYGRDAFIAEMNARAAQWGMTNTHYDDPSGLSVADQSTANDLLTLAQKVYGTYPQIFTITRTPQVTITESGSGTQSVVRSINGFAGQSNFVGGKTGYTDQASGNLLTVFSYESHPIFIIVLGTNDNDRFVNTQKLYDWFTRNFK